MTTTRTVAPATFAPSREDVLAQLAFFFGDPVVPERLRDYSEHHAMTFHFPDAYIGQNTKIRETLNNLILKQPDEWQTQVALPFVSIVGTTVEWDEVRFDVQLLQRVPYEGTSRMTTALRRRHRDRVVRRGIGLTIESDFYATEAGREHFSHQLKSIRYCVQETCNFDTIFAYLSCDNYDFRYELQKGLRSRRSVRMALAHEINMYGIVQKDQRGLEKAVEDVKYRMSRYNVKPNMLIIPPQLALYVSLAPEQKLTYAHAGPAGEKAFEAGMAGFEAQSFRGLGVFESKPYETTDEQDSLQMLQRSTQVGEFYRMSPPDVWDERKPLPAGYMDLMIYDEESDRHVHISFKQALYATTYGHAAGLSGDMFGFDKMHSEHKARFRRSFQAWVDRSSPPPPPPPPTAEEGGRGGMSLGPPGLARTTTEATKKTFTSSDAVESTETALRPLFVGPNPKLADPLEFTLSWELVETTIDALKVVKGDGKNRVAAFWVGLLVQLVDQGIWCPIEIIICRPFIEHLMLSAVVTVAGRDTGANLFGPADMQISANTSVKTIEGHYTCHTKTVITRPQNVYVMRDIMCAGYIAGGNTLFFGAAGSYIGGPLNPADVNTAINERLVFDDARDTGTWPSMLPLIGKFGTFNHYQDQVISISRQVLPWEATSSDSTKVHFPGGADNYTECARVFGPSLSAIHDGRDVQADESMMFMSQGVRNNALCFVGPHRRYNPHGNQYHELVPGQGHFGPDAIPGDMRWRRGDAVSLAAARDSMVSLQVAAQSQMFLTKQSNSGA